MNTILNEKSTGKIAESIYYPCIAMVLPLDNGKPDADYMKRLTDSIENEITEKYKRDKAVHVMGKFNHALSQVNYAGSKKSAVIFVSPSYETVIHLDMPLEESMVVDEPYEIRDLVDRMHPSDKYLVLTQSAHSFKVFLGNKDKLMKLKVNIPENIAAYQNDIAEKIENFTDTTDRKEIMMDKFIHHIDKELDSILNAYKLPVFVMGTERMNGHFKKITHHGKSIVGYVHGNYDDTTTFEMVETLKPYLKELRDIENKELQLKIDLALDANKLSSGIEEVWRSAMEQKGKLLIVEHNFYYPNLTDGQGNLETVKPGTNPSLVRDAVDVIIEKVLENGGDVKFADADMLSDFRHIALIQYY